MDKNVSLFGIPEMFVVDICGLASAHDELLTYKKMTCWFHCACFNSHIFKV